jgi:hypothetical protein
MSDSNIKNVLFYLNYLLLTIHPIANPTMSSITVNIIVVVHSISLTAVAIDIIVDNTVDITVLSTIDVTTTVVVTVPTPVTGVGVGVGVGVGIAPEPGEITVVHGAEGILFWDWRTRPLGKEQFWHGILDHDGVPRRRFYEVEKLFNELDKISIAVLLSYESLWAADIIEKGYYSHTYMGELVKAYKALWLNKVNIDVIPPEAPFDRYKIIVAPFLYLVNRDLVDKLRDFVYRGGTLVLTPRSFIKDEYNRVNIDLDKVYELTGLTSSPP